MPDTHLTKEGIMKTVVGVVKSRSDAELGAAELVPLEISKDKINILTPEVTDKEIAAVQPWPENSPAWGAAMGAVVGGAIGIAGGAGLAPAVPSFLVPGVGPVLGIGVLAGTLLGVRSGIHCNSLSEFRERNTWSNDKLATYYGRIRSN
jgi:hypothetical protein